MQTVVFCSRARIFRQRCGFLFTLYKKQHPFFVAQIFDFLVDNFFCRSRVVDNFFCRSKFWFSD